MSNVAPLPAADPASIIERVVVHGDLSRLTPAEKTRYYMDFCRSVGLNPMTAPLAYMSLQGKQVLYAKKDASEQLRKIHNISLIITDRAQIGDLYCVTVEAKLPNGRADSDMGAVSTVGLKGEALANAMLKAVTKAKRRVTLSIAGLGILDETEVDSIAGAQRIEPSAQSPMPEANLRQSADPTGNPVYDVETGEVVTDKDRYLHAAREVAAAGGPALDEYWKTLTKDIRALLVEYGQELRDIANKADAKLREAKPADDFPGDRA